MSESNFDSADRLRTAVNEGSRMLRGTFIAFISLCLYIGTVIGSTTDLQLLRVTDVELPLLRVNVGIVGFYVISPLLILTFHVALLIQLHILIDKVRNFEQRLKGLPFGDAEVLRQSTYPLLILEGIFTNRNTWFVNFLSHVILWVGIIVIPLLVLLWIELRFLPYQSDPVSFLQMLSFIIDLIAVALFFIGTSQAYTGIHFIASKVALNFAIPTTAVILAVVSVGPMKVPYTEVKIALLDRAIDVRSEILVSNNPPQAILSKLRNPNKSLTPDELRRVQGIDLAERNLRNADLSFSKMPKADLAYADLSGANLEGVNLQGATLTRAIAPRANLTAANLSGARMILTRLDRSNLEDANLNQGVMKSAFFIEATLAAARLRDAYMNEAVFENANLRNADLSSVQAKRANFKNAVLEGAKLKDANLEFAKLTRADLSDHAVWKTDLSGIKLGRACGSDVRWPESFTKTLRSCP